MDGMGLSFSPVATNTLLLISFFSSFPLVYTPISLPNASFFFLYRFVFVVSREALFKNLSLFLLSKY